MKKLLLLIQKKHHKVYLMLLFALSAVAILYVYPGQIQFKFDFQKGKIWPHETLYAPFSFTIKKTEKEIEQEKEKLKQNRELFFVKDAKIEEVQLAELRANWNGILAIENIDKNDSTRILNAMHFIFSRGVLENIQADFGAVYVMHENTVQRFLPADFYSMQTAKEVLVQTIENADVVNFLATYIVPNVVFNQTKTDEVLAQKVNNVLGSRGVVSAGDLIITKGRIVDEERYQVLKSLEQAYAQNTSAVAVPYQLLLGQLLYVVLLLSVLFAFFTYFRPKLFNYIANINLILFTVVWMVVLAIMVIQLDARWLFMVPFPILPIIMRAFFDSRIALFVHIITLLLVGYFAPNSFEFVLIEFVAGLAAIINVSGLYKRSQLFVAALKIIGVYLVSYGAFLLLEEGTIELEQYIDMGFLGASGIFSLFAFPLIFIYEKVFGQVSDLTLLELADTNSSLLRKLAQKAPGTFHHSVQVANLAETAALAIGANTLLVRTGALYHDIGKMNAPMYFVENQVTGVNPHDDLEFDESAAIIINHVKDGVKMAQKHRLPDLIVDFIRTHHGTSRVEYFYRQYIKNYPEEKNSEELFKYPGPEPFSKETAILMMADSVEAAARSLPEKTADKINQLIEGIVQIKMEQNQFDNADITLKEIGIIKQIFKRQLANIYHARIEYPEKLK